MNDVRAHWEFLISHSAAIMGIILVLFVGLLQFSRLLRLTETSKLRLKIALLAVFSVCFYLIAFTYLYQGTRIFNVHKVLVEMNAPFYEGGQGISAVADEDTLKALKSVATRSTSSAVVALVLSLTGSWLLNRMLKRHQRLASIDATPHRDLGESKTKRA